MKYPDSIQKLIDLFSTLPTVGPKTAERYVFYLLKQPEKDLKKIADSILELKTNLKLCSNCLNITEQNPCTVCSDSKRNKNLLCIVANGRDIVMIEKTKQFNGLYFVLGGELNTIKGINPEQLNIERMVKKIKQGNITEIVLALNPTLEGETTSMYVTKLIKSINANIKITRLARGLATGADLEYADEITLANAFKYRTDL